MTQLAKYDAACRAIAEAKAVDEVLDLRNTAEAMRAYAKQAKNKQLEIDAALIRMRAERRIGELMEQQRETVGLNEGGRPRLTGSAKRQWHKAEALSVVGQATKQIASANEALMRLPAEV